MRRAAAFRLALVLPVFAGGTLALVLWQRASRLLQLGDPRRPALLWHRMVLRMIGVRVEVTGRVVEARPLLIAANHVSWTDIMVLGSAAPVNFIAKAQVSRWPVLGRLFRSQNTVFVEREARRRSAEQARAVARNLAAGDPLVLFAEGTTGDGNRLLPFKSTLFGAAAELNAQGDTAFAVQPAAIVYRRRLGVAMGHAERLKASWTGDQELVPHLLDLIADGPFDVELRFGEPISFAGSNRKRVAADTQADVRAMIAAIRRG